MLGVYKAEEEVLDLLCEGFFISCRRFLSKLRVQNWPIQKEVQKGCAQPCSSSHRPTTSVGRIQGDHQQCLPVRMLLSGSLNRMDRGRGDSYLGC